MLCLVNKIGMLQHVPVSSTRAVKRTSRTCSWITIKHLLSLNLTSASNIVAPKNEDTEVDITNKNSPDYKVVKSSICIKKYLQDNFDDEKINQFPISSVDKDMTSEIKFQELVNNLKELQILVNNNQMKLSCLLESKKAAATIKALKHCSPELLKLLMLKLNVNKINNLLVEENISEELVIEIIKNLDIYESITFLSKLAVAKSRPTSVIQILSSNIINSKTNIGIKLLADIFYGISILSFYNNELIEYLIKNLIETVPSSENHASIMSITKSLGVLHIKDINLLDKLSIWFVANAKIVKPHDVSNLLTTLAILGYTPVNFDDLLKCFLERLTGINVIDKFHKLDTVWALTIINKATLKDYQSILNDEFLSSLFDKSSIIIPKVIKVLNINAAALLNTPDYTGPVLPLNSSFYEIPLKFSKEKIKFSTCIIKALKLLLPGDKKYLNTNVNTQMGFSYDAEFCVDAKLTPYPININTEKKIYRIAVLSAAYNELCYGLDETIGPVKFYLKMLEQQGYTTLVLHYSEVFLKESSIERAKYIIQQLKLAINT